MSSSRCHLSFALFAAFAVQAAAARGGPVSLKLDTAQAEAVLAIVNTRLQGQALDNAAWQRLFTTEAYLRLKKREAELKRDFSNDDFRKFVESDALVKRAPELEQALREWASADLDSSARRILGYLPAGAFIRATVYIVIKPQQNSFVYDVKTNPAIFLYLDPAVTRQKFENTVAHELHHIAYSSLTPQLEAKLIRLSPAARRAAEWVGAFGEGFAMLAAAGGPDVHPHAVSSPGERKRWDASLANFNADLKRVEKFFLDVLDGRLESQEEVRKAAFEFFGIQGPWYTVGWQMAAMIERRYGRAELLECMQSPARLLSTYNRAAREQNRAAGEPLALWSERLIDGIR